MAPTTTSGSRSSIAWAARPHQPVTRHNRDQALLRAFHRVPSKVGVRANAPTTDEPTLRAAVQMIESPAESEIGPKFDNERQAQEAGNVWRLNTTPIFAAA